MPGCAPDPEQTAADGQMGCIMKLYREWQLSGDRAFLEKYWPACKSALSYVWKEKGWDGNRDGVDKSFRITSKPGKWFWSNGSAWGTVTITEQSAVIEVLEGHLLLESFTCGERACKKRIHLDAGQEGRFVF